MVLLQDAGENRSPRIINACRREDGAAEARAAPVRRDVDADIGAIRGFIEAYGAHRLAINLGNEQALARRSSEPATVIGPRDRLLVARLAPRFWIVAPQPERSRVLRGDRPKRDL